ncbi:helix-turn-helix domain-containing protein [Desulfosporosinus sp. SB140]|uniref:helix-turn-helix domain-containing protein n=1 Tax=Desulfosporosinus paludis TaxID=3115649 RepID=UPI0038902295
MSYFKAKVTIKVSEKPQIDERQTVDVSIMDEEERNRYVKNNIEQSHEQKVLKKQKLINTVRDMHEKKFSIRAISKELQLSRQTVTRYLDEGITAIHGNYSVKRTSILDQYLGEINTLIDKGIASTVIEAKIRQKGYTGSSSTLRNYAAGRKKLIQSSYNANNMKPENTQIVERKFVDNAVIQTVGENQRTGQRMFRQSQWSISSVQGVSRHS